MSATADTHKKQSAIYRRLDLASLGQRIFFAALVALAMIGCAIFVHLGGQGEWNARGAHYEEHIEHTEDGGQYAHLADALLAGRVSLDLPVADILLEMDNPYDMDARLALDLSGEETVYWDYAFYDGKYYCYFGIVPCLLTFLPYKAMTGQDLPADWAVLLFGWIAILAIFFTLLQFQKAYFRNMSVYGFAIALLFFFAACGIWDQMFFARFYSVAIMSSLCFALLGLGYWLKAKRELDAAHEAGVWLVLGSLCMALTLGCRPQLVLAACLSFPIFWQNIKRRQFFSKEGSRNTALIILPFFVVFLPICWYNYIRFDSPFDFGAVYNLTVTDMAAYSPSPQRIVFRTFEYLFMPFIPMGEFPFFQAVNTAITEGTLPGSFFTWEPYFAGAFFLAPASLVLFLAIAPSTRRKLAKRKAGAVALVSGYVALMLVVLDTAVSGVNMRYFADFMWLFVLAAVAVFWAVSDDGSRRMACNVMLALVILGIMLCGWSFLGLERVGALCNTQPALFYGIAGLFG